MFCREKIVHLASLMNALLFEHLPIYLFFVIFIIKDHGLSTWFIWNKALDQIKGWILLSYLAFYFQMINIKSAKRKQWLLIHSRISLSPIVAVVVGLHAHTCGFMWSEIGSGFYPLILDINFADSLCLIKLARVLTA